MNECSPERLGRHRLYIALRSASTAGLLALSACNPAQPVEIDASPVVNVPAHPHPCETPQPTCSPSPPPSETESPEPTKSPSPKKIKVIPPEPPGFACEWIDQDGKRQPLVSEDDVIVKVDGRCREPDPLAPINVHARPELKGPVVDTVENGDELVATCSFRGNTKFIDARGPRSVSRIVLRVLTPHGQEGFVSELTVGYVDETQLQLNGSLPACDLGS